MLLRSYETSATTHQTIPNRLQRDAFERSLGPIREQQAGETKSPRQPLLPHGIARRTKARCTSDQEVFENESDNPDPASVKLADYFPDTAKFPHACPLSRPHGSDRRNCRSTISKLKEDGLLEDTFVFYGDHGGVLPRGGYIYESGLHVPLDCTRA